MSEQIPVTNWLLSLLVKGEVDDIRFRWQDPIRGNRMAGNICMITLKKGDWTVQHAFTSEELGAARDVELLIAVALQPKIEQLLRASRR